MSYNATNSALTNVQKPKKKKLKKDIRVKYLRNHISLTVGNVYMHPLSHIASNIVALFVYDIFLKLLG